MSQNALMCFSCQDATSRLIVANNKVQKGLCAWCGKFANGYQVENKPPKKQESAGESFALAYRRSTKLSAGSIWAHRTEWPNRVTMVIEIGSYKISIHCDDSHLGGERLFRSDIRVFEGDHDITEKVFPGLMPGAVVHADPEKLIIAMTWCTKVSEEPKRNKCNNCGSVALWETWDHKNFCTLCSMKLHFKVRPIGATGETKFLE